jgi:hypothetical protein
LKPCWSLKRKLRKHELNLMLTEAAS